MQSFLRSLSIALLSISTVMAQSQDVFVDQKGIMRWGDTKEEVKGFGVNYTAMFAHAYRTAKKMNISVEQAIENDVYHFARLGFDLYRVHVWDTEISDTLGNVLNNEHLRLFDYTLAKMKERGMKFMITPIAFWGNGWPEPDEKTPGFSRKYGKDACLTNEEAIKAQEKYLFQFINHVNNYTRLAYKNDPSIIAFEISNEPHHGEAPEKVTAFINRMSKAIKKTGCKKPIFYNISHSIHLIDAYMNADIQGGTFQWYPTGLGSRHELGGNLLPNVDKYGIPFAANARFKKSARIVYEFDAADVGRSYIYPAMARSFREAGMQIATHFAYDPTFMADVNTEYGTHYMNLAYAPQKALSLKIASAVFHQVPLYKNYGAYPDNVTFENFRVSYEQDLAEMTTPTDFYYTNNTATKPGNESTLAHIAGFGNSAIVSYEGTGAYFLDKVEAGVWRLEIMPDAIWVNDPFERTSPRKKVAVINWREWPITINLNDLGENFTLAGINDKNTFSGIASGKTITVGPGTYLLSKKGVTSNFKGTEKLGNILLKEFSAPPTSLTQTYVLHKPVFEITSGRDHIISADIVSPSQPTEVEVNFFMDGQWAKTKAMKKINGYRYEATIPASDFTEGFLHYFITVKDGTKSQVFPSGLNGTPWDWDFYETSTYQTRVVAKDNPILLFDATTDANDLSRQWLKTSALKPTKENGQAELQVNVEKLFTPDPENKNGDVVADYSMRYYFGSKTAGRKNDLLSKKELIFKGRSLNEKPCKLQVALIMKDGSTYGGIVTLESTSKEHRLRLTELYPANLVTLPRPYPTFLPYYFIGGGKKGLNLAEIEVLQLSIGPALSQEELQQKNGIAIEKIWIE